MSAGVADEPVSPVPPSVQARRLSFAHTLARVCTELGVPAGQPAHFALHMCNVALGITADGPLVVQLDRLATRLGIQTRATGPASIVADSLVGGPSSSSALADARDSGPELPRRDWSGVAMRTPGARSSPSVEVDLMAARCPVANRPSSDMMPATASNLGASGSIVDEDLNARTSAGVLSAPLDSQLESSPTSRSAMAGETADTPVARLSPSHKTVDMVTSQGEAANELMASKARVIEAATRASAATQQQALQARTAPEHIVSLPADASVVMHLSAIAGIDMGFDEHRTMRPNARVQRHGKLQASHGAEVRTHQAGSAMGDAEGGARAHAIPALVDARGDTQCAEVCEAQGGIGAAGNGRKLTIELRESLPEWLSDEQVDSRRKMCNTQSLTRGETHGQEGLVPVADELSTGDDASGEYVSLDEVDELAEEEFAPATHELSATSGGFDTSVNSWWSMGTRVVSPGSSAWDSPLVPPRPAPPSGYPRATAGDPEHRAMQ